MNIHIWMRYNLPICLKKIDLGIIQKCNDIKLKEHDLPHRRINKNDGNRIIGRCAHPRGTSALTQTIHWENPQLGSRRTWILSLSLLRLQGKETAHDVRAHRQKTPRGCRTTR